MVAPSTVVSAVEPPTGVTVDAGNGALLDEIGQAVGSPSQSLASKIEEVESQLGPIKMVPKLSEEDIQRLTSGKKLQDGYPGELSNRLPPDPETVSIYDPVSGELIGTRPYRPQDSILPVEAPVSDQAVSTPPRLTPRDWTPDGYRPAPPDRVQTADLKIHQVAPGVFVDDNWNRLEAPNTTQFDMDGNPRSVAPPALTGLPEGWSVDPNSGEILDASGRAVGPGGQPRAEAAEVVASEDASPSPALTEARATTARRDASLAQLAQGPMVVAGQEISQVDGYLAISDASWDRFNAAYTRLPEGSQARIDEEMTVVMSDWVEANGAEAFNGAAPEIRQELGWTWQAQAANNYANSTEAAGDPADLVDLGDGARQYIEARAGFIQSGGLATPAAPEQGSLEAALPDKAVAGEPASSPRLLPRDWTPEGYRPARPDILGTAVERSHQVAPGVFVDDKWNRIEAPDLKMHDMEGNPISVSPPVLTGLPEGWTVDPNNGAILDDKGQPMGSPVRIQPAQPGNDNSQQGLNDLERLTPGQKLQDTYPRELSNRLPPDPETVSIYDPVTGELIGTRPFDRQEYSLPIEPLYPERSQQEFSQPSEIKTTESPIAPPPGKSMFASVAGQLAARMESDASTSAPDSKGSIRQIAPPPGKVVGAAGVGEPLSPAPVAQDGVVSLAAAEPPAGTKGAIDLAGVQSRYVEYMQAMPLVNRTIGSGDSESSGWFEPTQEERDAYAASFIDSATGVNAAELGRLEQAAQVENQRLTAESQRVEAIRAAAAQKEAEEAARLAALERLKESRANFAAAAYGLNQRDKELLANPGSQAALAQLEARRALFEAGLGALGSSNSVSGASEPIPEEFLSNPDFVIARTQLTMDGELNIPVLRYQNMEEFLAAYVDSATGFSAKDLLHLKESQVEQAQGEAAMKKLEGLKLGSFTRDKDAEALDASRVFTVIGRDQREALLAQGYSQLGKALVLESTGQLILPDEHETGVYFLSSLSAGTLREAGVIDIGNGGLNIDGLYLDGGNAHIGTARPKGGLFGNFLNHVGNLMPGGKLGDLMADAISDTTGLVADGLVNVLEMVGEDKDDFATQLVLHQQASVDVVAHAREHGDNTYRELLDRTSEYAQVDQVASAIGQAMISTGVLAWAGVGVTVVAGSVNAGRAQLAGDNSADPNQGFVQAATAFALSQLGQGVGQAFSGGNSTVLATNVDGVVTGAQAVGGGAASAATSAGGLAEAATSFGTSAANSAVNQLSTTGEIDVRGTIAAGALGVVGANTHIAGGINAVQLYQLADAIEDDNAAGIASSLVGMVGSFQNDRLRRAQEEQRINDYLRSQGGRSQEVLDLDAVQGAPSAGTPSSGLGVADDPAAGGPQSGGGPEEPEAGPRDPRAGLRAIENRTGDQVVQQPDGSWVTIAPANPGVPGSQPTVARWERVDDSGRTVVTNYGPEGNALSHRITLPSGVIIEQPEGSNRVAITAGTQDEAFAAARSQGLAVFEYEGRPINTLRADQIAATESRLLAANPELSRLSPSELRQLVLNATGAHAMSVFRNSTMANAPGLDAGTISAGVNLGATRQEIDRLAGRAPVTTPTPDPVAPPPSQSQPSTFVDPVIDFSGTADDMNGTPTDAPIGTMGVVAGNVGRTPEVLSALHDRAVTGLVNLLESATPSGGPAMSPLEAFGAVVNTAIGAAGNAIQTGSDRLNTFVNSVDANSTGPVDTALIYAGAAISLALDVAEGAVTGAAEAGRRAVNTYTNPNATTEELAQALLDVGSLAEIFIGGAGFVRQGLRSGINVVGRPDLPGNAPAPGRTVDGPTPARSDGPDPIPGASGSPDLNPNLITPPVDPPQAVRSSTPDAPVGPVRVDGNSPANPAGSGTGPGVPDLPPVNRAGQPDGSVPARTDVEPPIHRSGGTEVEGGAPGTSPASELDLNLDMADAPAPRIPTDEPGIQFLTEWKVIEEGRIRTRTYDDAFGNSWLEQEVDGVRSRIRDNRGSRGLQVQAITAEQAAGVGPARVPFDKEDPQGPSTVVRGVFPEKRRTDDVDPREVFQQAMVDLPPGARSHLPGVYLSKEIGDTLDAGGAIIPDQPLLGLAAKDGSMILDQRVLYELDDAKATIYHELGHKLDAAMGNASRREPWGDKYTVDGGALQHNAEEQFAEISRDVLGNWRDYEARTPADWAREPGTLAEKKMEILRFLGVKVPEPEALAMARSGQAVDLDLDLGGL